MPHAFLNKRAASETEAARGSHIVQFVETLIRKVSPALLRTLGIFLPLITTRFERSLLGELPRLAWRSVLEVYRAVLHRSDLVPGMVAALDTFGPPPARPAADGPP